MIPAIPVVPPPRSTPASDREPVLRLREVMERITAAAEFDPSGTLERDAGALEQAVADVERELTRLRALVRRGAQTAAAPGSGKAPERHPTRVEALRHGRRAVSPKSERRKPATPGA